MKYPPLLSQYTPEIRETLNHFRYLIVLAFSCQICPSQEIISFGSSWEFLNPLNGVDPALNDSDFNTTWYQPTTYDGPGFSDAAPALLGYGSIGEQEIVTNIGTPPSGQRYTAYFRKTFTTTVSYKAIELEVLADDGGIFYLDGEPLKRFNFDQEDTYEALTVAEGDERSTTKFLIDLDLPPGEHTLAFSLHNHLPTSSDIGFDLQVTGNPEPVDYLEFEEADGEIFITGTQKNVRGELLIPSAINGLPVTKIGNGAFNESRWDSIVVAEGVTEIGSFAFQFCRELSALQIPESLISISDLAFYWCPKLTHMRVPDSVTIIGRSAFRDCVALKEINLPPGLTRIHDYTFMNCWSLESISIPEQVTEIGKSGFLHCRSLTSLEIPDGITQIEDTVFLGCTNVTQITIPEDVTSIGAWAFSQSGLTRITIPDKVTSIGESAFAGCADLMEAELGRGLESIGRDAFADTQIVGQNEDDFVYLKSSNAAFLISAPDSNSDVVIPSLFQGLPVKSVNAFFGKGVLSSVKIPDGVASIGNSAFSSSRNLRSISIPESVALIGSRAFLGSGLLSAITFLGKAPEVAELNAFSRISEEAAVYVRPENAASFGGEGATWNGLPVTLLSSKPEIQITDVSLLENSITIDFNDQPRVISWQITASTDLENFSGDLIETYRITETSPGEYRAVIEIRGEPRNYFVRVER